MNDKPHMATPPPNPLAMLSHSAQAPSPSTALTSVPTLPGQAATQSSEIIVNESTVTAPEAATATSSSAFHSPAQQQPPSCPLALRVEGYAALGYHRIEHYPERPEFQREVCDRLERHLVREECRRQREVAIAIFAARRAARELAAKEPGCTPAPPLRRRRSSVSPPSRSVRQISPSPRPVPQHLRSLAQGMPGLATTDTRGTSTVPPATNEPAIVKDNGDHSW